MTSSPNKLMTLQLRYEKKNADKIRERKMLWYLENKQKVKEWQYKYYQANPEKLAKRMEQSKLRKRELRKKCVEDVEISV